MSEVLEKAAGQRAARTLKTSIRRQIKNDFNRKTGLMLRTSVRPKTKFGQLDHLTITSPKYSFFHHYGYTRKYGSKSIFTPGKEHLAKALNNSRALETLATELGNIRADEVITKIRF